MRISFLKNFNFFIVFVALIVFQLSVRMDRGKGLLSKKWTGVDRGRKVGLETDKNKRTSFMDGPYKLFMDGPYKLSALETSALTAMLSFLLTSNILFSFISIQEYWA